MGRDLHEAERVRRLLPARVGLSRSPAHARQALHGREAPDVVLLEDRAWGAGDEEALDELRERAAARTLALILSRRRGERWERGEVPVVERPYQMEAIIAAMQLSLLRRKA